MGLLVPPLSQIHQRLKYENSIQKTFSFREGWRGFIVLILLAIVSYFYNPAYLPLHPRSPTGHFFLSQHVHVPHHALLRSNWFIMGAIFR